MTRARQNALVAMTATAIVASTWLYPRDPAAAIVGLVVSLLVVAALATLLYLVDALRADHAQDQQPPLFEQSAYYYGRWYELCQVGDCPRASVTLFAPLRLRVCTGHDERLAVAFGEGRHVEELEAMGGARAS